MRHLFFQPSSALLPVVEKMSEVQKACNKGKYVGVCSSTLTHRDVFFPPEVLGHYKNTVIVQKPGMLVIVHPSAIHNVQNTGKSLAESRNYLPWENMKEIASYKVCDCQVPGAKPLLETMKSFILNLDWRHFIHESDANKINKIRAIENLQLNGKDAHFQDAIRHIRRSHENQAWLMDLIPVVESGPQHKFSCENCLYSTPNHGDLVKHVRRMHKKTKPPKNLYQEECPGCYKILKCLRKHRKICTKRKRED